MRTNPTTPAHKHPAKPIRPFTRIPPEGVTESPKRVHSGTYHTDMGDTPIYIRPGAMDFLRYQSKGYSC